jgi:hypothetical protein
MKQLMSITVAAVVLAATAFALDSSDEQKRAPEIHPCGNNPFTRSVGLLGGRQHQSFLKGPNIRDEQPPQADRRTRVVDVTGQHRLNDPLAEPDIDKCASWLEWNGSDGLVKLTVLWNDRNCNTVRTSEDSPDCRGRMSFGFSLDELGIRERPETKQAWKALESRLERDFLAEVYFSRQVRARARRPDTGQWKPARAEVHLVARVIPVSSLAAEETGAEGNYQLMRKPVVQDTPE